MAPPASLPAAATTTTAHEAESPERRQAVAAEAHRLLEAAVRGAAARWAAEEGVEAIDPEQCLVVLSGGVDSSITWHLATSLLGCRYAVTLLAGDEAADAPWCRVAAGTAADTLAGRGKEMDHRVLTPTLGELLDEDMPFLVETLRSFDPMSLRNSVCVTRVLREAAARGFKYVLTGDAADELLAGYAFSARLEDEAWARHRQGMVARMKFDAIAVGAALGLKVTSPYLDMAFIDFAMSLSKRDCVGPVHLRPTPEAELDATPTVTGKVPIRLAFPQLPTASRRKDPAEIGCGTTLLGAAPWASPPRAGYFDARISDEEFEAAKARAREAHGVVLRDKEHLAYFRVFEAVFGEGGGSEEEEEEGKRLRVPGKTRPNDDPCPACGFDLAHPKETFCRTCGHYDAKLAGRHEAKAQGGDGGGREEK